MVKLALDQDLKLSTMPQVMHRNVVSNNQSVFKIINFAFILLEVVFVLFIFFFLFLYRLSVEFNYSFLTFLTNFTELNSIPRFEYYMVFLGIFIILWTMWSSHLRVFSISWDFNLTIYEESIKVIKALSYSILIAIGIAFLLKMNDYSRFVIILFWLSSVVSSIILRGLRRIIVYSLLKKGFLTRNVLIIGAGQVGQMISSELQKKMGIGLNIVGFLDDHKKGEVNQHFILGQFKDINKVIYNYPIDEIIITIPTERQLINDFINKYRKFNFTIKIVPEMFNLVSKTIEVTHNNNIPFITLIKTPMRGSAFLIKRTADFILASIGVLVLIPLFLIISILIKSDSKGPILYKQKRVGKDGNLFNMYKFRSMIINADELKKNLERQNQVKGPAFKIKEDPRVTKIGKFLRKYSIDELPQLFNVLRGEMSLIGPRPPIPSEVDRYNDLDWRRLEVVPGITGLWQVSGRSDLSFEQWVNLDIYYIENWSLWMDIKILIKTIPVVIKGEGAY